MNAIEELIYAYKQSNGDGVGVGKAIIIQEAEQDLARITAELKTKDEQVKAVTALINEWRFIAIERPMPTDRAIGYETCADELQAALNAALKQSS